MFGACGDGVTQGQGGYFFSPHLEDMSTTLMKLFFQYLEGSLLDWQLGDLMPSCTAGDIRVSFAVKDPDVVSVVGKVESRGPGYSEPIVVRGFQTPKGHDVALLHEGDKSAETMMQDEIRDLKWSCFRMRGLLLLWALPVAHLTGAAFGRKLTSLTREVLLSTVGLWMCCLGATWILLYGLELGFQWFDLGGPMFLGAGAMALSYALSISPLADEPPGMRAVWTMIGRTAGVPPAWRQAASYAYSTGHEGPDDEAGFGTSFGTQKHEN